MTYVPVLAFLRSVYADLGVAVGIGLLLGLQRERRLGGQGVRGIAGARTFPLVALLGAVSVLAGGTAAPWLPAAALLGVTALTVAGYLRVTALDPPSVGLTTEALLLLTFVLGALAAAGSREVAAVVGAAALVLVGLKSRLHGFAGRLTDADEVATLKFVAVALLVLPLLPDADLGPYGALNPHQVGRLVVLVAAVSFLGYVASKVVDARRGLLATGLLGGLVSSTATTAALARRSRDRPDLAPALAAGTLAACSVLYARVLVLVAVAAPAFLPHVAPFLAAMALPTVLTAVTGLVAMLRSPPTDVPLTNPFELKPAIWFALLFAVVGVVAKAAEHWFGHAGLYVAGVLAGLTDVDAITLSAGRLLATGTDPAVLARMVALAAMANSASKAAIAAGAGTRPYARRVAAGLLASVLAGGVVFLL